MKKLIPVLIFLIALCACGPSIPKISPRQDTVLIVGRNQGNVVFLDSAIVNISVVKEFQDSGSLSGRWGIDTAIRLGQRLDTVFDKDKKPVLDSFHNPIVHFVYPAEPTPRAFNKWIKVVDYIMPPPE